MFQNAIFSIFFEGGSLPPGCFLIGLPQKIVKIHDHETTPDVQIPGLLHDLLVDNGSVGPNDNAPLLGIDLCIQHSIPDKPPRTPIPWRSRSRRQRGSSGATRCAAPKRRVVILLAATRISMVDLTATRARCASSQFSRRISQERRPQRTCRRSGVISHQRLLTHVLHSLQLIQTIQIQMQT